MKFATLSIIESSRMNRELYNFVIYDDSNRVMAAAAAIREPWVPQLDNNNRLKLTHKNDNICLMEEPRYNNNHPETYNNE